MAKWSSLGHGMRRRMGAPSNHLESAGKSMARNIPTSDEHMAKAAASGSARIAMGMNAYNVSPNATMDSVDEMSTNQLQGTLVPKHNTQSMDPTNPGSKGPRRTPVLDVGGEKLGAAYRVKATSSVIDPAAGATMANAKIVPSVAGRANPNFDSGNQASYI
jgi:hypothetical protein